MPLLPIAWIEAIFATKAALTPRLCGGAISQEVVLANAIHGLLRVRDGRFCRKGLKVHLRRRSLLRSKALRTEGLIKARWAGD